MVQLDRKAIKTNVFSVITTLSRLGGAEYSFLKDYDNWMLVTSPLNFEEADLYGHPLCEVINGTPFIPEPTMEWVKDNKIISLFIPGMSYATFAMEQGIDITIGDGIGLATAKRMSRFMRPMFVFGTFESSDVSITELQLSPDEMMAIDGGGVVLRDRLLSMIEKLPVGLTPQKRRALVARLKHINRVEFTIMDALGQRKGHAMVSDEIDTDFIIPLDIKKDSKLVNGQTFISFDLSFSAKDNTLLDKQSMINFNQFYDVGMLASYMNHEAKLFEKALRSGEYSAMMGRIQNVLDEDGVANWHITEFAASGGDFMWSPKLVRDVFSQHIQKISARYEDKVRYPIPAGSAYVMSDAVAELAGYQDVLVQPGEAQFDMKRATLWINRHDWTNWVAKRLGGMDSDDRVNVQQGKNEAGEKFMLVWRSPNQLGEYAIFKPAVNCDTIEWATEDGMISWPDLCPKRLPPVIESVPYEYVGKIENKTKLPAMPYSVENMRKALARAQGNAGALGMYCNIMMVLVAVYGYLPLKMYLPLEYIIDATVKDGRDVSGVKDWCYFMANKMLMEGVAVPRLIADKFAGLIGKDKSFRLTTNHWMDALEIATAQHIKSVEAMRDELMSIAVMPAEMAGHVTGMKYARMGSGFLQCYNNGMRGLLKASGGNATPETHDTLRERCENYMSLCVSEGAEEHEVLLGALMSANIGSRNDSACWQIQGTGERQGGFAHATIEALRKIGLLNELAITEDGMIAFPGAFVLDAMNTAISITAVWWKLLQATDATIPPEVGMSQFMKVNKERALQAKALIRQWAEAGRFNKEWAIKKLDDRMVLMTENGNVFGFIDRRHEKLVEGMNTLKILGSFGADGNLTAIISK